MGIIYRNGTLKYKIVTGGGKDPETGYPIQVKESWSDPIECHIDINRQSNLGKYDGGTFTIASYIIFIDLQPFDAKRIHLTRDGLDLGEFQVQSVDIKHRNRKIQITV